MIVVDASVWISLLVAQDVHHASSRTSIEKATKNGEPLVAPVLMLAEVAGAIARRTGDPQLGRRAVAQLMRLPTLRIVRIDPQLGQMASEVAADYRLCGADAVYVATAQQLQIALITWDREQLTRSAGLIAAFTPDDAPDF